MLLDTGDAGQTRPAYRRMTHYCRQDADFLRVCLPRFGDTMFSYGLSPISDL